MVRNNHPKFVRTNKRYKAKVGDEWRKPRGIDNSHRVKKRGFPALPKIGFGTKRQQRDLHPTGVREKLVFTIKELKEVEQGFAARIGGTVGAKKKATIIEAAKKQGIKVLNE